MDQFDKLVKEKAEQREFKYKPLFWLLFAKQAGFMAFSAIQIVSGVLIVGGIISGSVLLTYKLVTKNETPKIVEKPLLQHAISDTTLQLSPEIVTQQDTLIPENSGTIPPKELTQKPKTAQQQTEKNPIKKDTVKIQKVIPNNPYLGRRILTIDTDTILTND
jgi:hypothetical protein